MLNRNLIIAGVESRHTVRLPAFYRFVIVLNHSPHNLSFFSTNTNPENLLYQVPARFYATLPLIGSNNLKDKGEIEYIVTSDGVNIAPTVITLVFDTVNHFINTTMVTHASEVNLLGLIAPYTTPTHSHIGVTNISQQVLTANPGARYRLLQNDSANTIYLMLGVAALINQGIRLDPGGSYELSGHLGNLWRGTINAIAGVAGPSNLMILEAV